MIFWYEALGARANMFLSRLALSCLPPVADGNAATVFSSNPDARSAVTRSVHRNTPREKGLQKSKYLYLYPMQRRGRRLSYIRLS